MELRWLVEVDKYSTWNDRWDVWDEHEYRKLPVLQFRLPDEDWQEVPTVTIVTSKE